MVNFTSPPRTASTIPKAPPPGSIPQPRPDGFPAETVPDWNNIGLFTAGIAIGAILGASVALLLARRGGDETEESSGSSVRYRGDDDLWNELATELERAAAEREEEEEAELKEVLKT